MRTVTALMVVLVVVLVVRALATPDNPPPTHLAPWQCAQLAQQGNPAAQDPHNCP